MTCLWGGISPPEGKLQGALIFVTHTVGFCNLLQLHLRFAISWKCIPAWWCRDPKLKDLDEASSPEEVMPMCGADDKEMQRDYFSVASYWPSFGAGRQMNASCKHEHWAPSAPFCQEASPETNSIFTSDPSQLTPLSAEDSPIKHF